MEYLLRTKFGFSQDNILLMVDNHTDPLRRPTRWVRPASHTLTLGWRWAAAAVAAVLLWH